MIRELCVYPAYKSSGVDWLGDVPAHWEVWRLKHSATLIMGQSPSSDECSSEPEGLPFLQGCAEFGPLHPNPILYCRTPKKASPANAILMSVRAPVGRLNVADQVYCIGRGLCAVIPREEFFQERYAFFQLYALQQGLAMAATGSTYDAVSIGDVGSQPTILPSLAEQRAIARYLDHVDLIIQRYVEAKEKLIALLQEARQAIIQRAVTRGLDPDVPLKPSGVGWLGDVPAHWEISRVKSEFISLNYRRIPLNAVERGEMKERRYDYYGASGVIDKVEDYLFDDELLLIAEDGANLVLRNLPLAIIARGKFWVNNHAHILKPRRGNLEFLAAVMEGLNYAPWISGAAQPKLTQERLMNITIAVPSRSEQDEIMTKIESQTSKLSAAIDNACRQVEFMAEYRSSLIAHVVTGKLDVRAAAELLPQESRELAVS